MFVFNTHIFYNRLCHDGKIKIKKSVILAAVDTVRSNVRPDCGKDENKTQIWWTDNSAIRCVFGLSCRDTQFFQNWSDLKCYSAFILHCCTKCWNRKFPQVFLLFQWGWRDLESGNDEMWPDFIVDYCFLLSHEHRAVMIASCGENVLMWICSSCLYVIKHVTQIVECVSCC